MSGGIDELAEARARLRADKGAQWRTMLIVGATKEPRALLANALLALRAAPEWGGVLAYDEFALTVMAKRPPPWVPTNGGWAERVWGDRDDVLTAEWLQHQGIHVNERVAMQAAMAVAKDASFHPIRDYLCRIVWDGTARVETFALNYLGAEDTIYHRTVGQCFLISAVARVMRPGCQVDHMLIAEGPQGAGKSSLARLMFEPWFSDDIAELGSKDSAMQVRVAWGIEIAELASMTRGEIERVKAFVSRRVDRFRPSYGRHVIQVERQSVFIGTTNADAYLKDETGARRSWPVKCGNIDLAGVARDRDQLWAEAVSLYRGGEPWWLADATDVALASAEQSARYVDDAWAGPMAAYLEGRADTSVGEILHEALDLLLGSWGQPEQNRVARCLRVLRWERYRGPRPKREWRYRHASED